MNKVIVISFFVACVVGCAIAGYGSGTPGYYDPWTYYGGYDRYYNRYGYRNQPTPYYPMTRNGYYYDAYSRGRSSYYPVSRYSSGGRNYNRISYDDMDMY